VGYVPRSSLLMQLAIDALCRPPNKLQRTVIPIAGAQQARHFIMRLLRAGQRIARPLNCGVVRRG
jgi:hypothetical protein